MDTGELDELSHLTIDKTTVVAGGEPVKRSKNVLTVLSLLTLFFTAAASDGGSLSGLQILLLCGISLVVLALCVGSGHTASTRKMAPKAAPRPVSRSPRVRPARQVAHCPGGRAA